MKESRRLELRAQLDCAREVAEAEENHAIAAARNLVVVVDIYNVAV